jgi:hypothetical protein
MNYLRHSARLLALFTIALLALTAPRTASAQRAADKFTILDFAAAAINNRGQIAGLIFENNFSHVSAIVYDHGVRTVFDVPGVQVTQPFGINDRGQVVGWYYNFGDSILHSFLYDHGVLTLLPELPGAVFGTTVTGINNRGQIVGFGTDGNFNSLGFVYDRGVFTTIEFPGSIVPGGLFGGTAPAGINDHGQIVGSWFDSISFNSHVFVYDRGVFTTLTDIPDAVFAGASGINNRGQIVGSYFSPDFTATHGFVYDRGVYTIIDFPGSSRTFLSGINDRGQIVGNYEDTNFNVHYFLLTRDGDHGD